MDESKLSAISQLLLRCSPSDVVDLPFGDIIERLELGLDKDFLPVLKGKSTSIVNVSKRLRSLRSLYKNKADERQEEFKHLQTISRNLRAHRAELKRLNTTVISNHLPRTEVRWDPNTLRELIDLIATLDTSSDEGRSELRGIVNVLAILGLVD